MAAGFSIPEAVRRIKQPSADWPVVDVRRLAVNMYGDGTPDSTLCATFPCSRRRS